MTPKSTSSPKSDGFSIKSSGIPLHGTTIRIVDQDTGLPVQSFNEVGEIYIYGPQVTPGYLRNEEANKSSFMSDKKFFRSGDAGYIDPRGHLFVSDRFKEVIKFDGVQVSPSELESILREHPIVKEVAVVGIPDDLHGQVPKGFVVLNFVPASLSSGTDTQTMMANETSGTEKNGKEIRGEEEDNIMKPDDDGCDGSCLKETELCSFSTEKEKLSYFSSLSLDKLEKELIVFVSNQVAPFKQIRGGIEFLESFPRTIIGKIDRKVLRSKT